MQVDEEVLLQNGKYMLDEFCPHQSTGRVCVWVSCNRPSLPDADAVVENDSFDIPDGQTLMSRLQWEDSPDISPTDSASSKASKEATRITLKVIFD